DPGPGPPRGGGDPGGGAGPGDPAGDLGSGAAPTGGKRYRGAHGNVTLGDSRAPLRGCCEAVRCPGWRNQASPACMRAECQQRRSFVKRIPRTLMPCLLIVLLAPAGVAACGGNAGGASGSSQGSALHQALALAPATAINFAF